MKLKPFSYEFLMGWRGEPRYTKCDTDHTYSAAKLAGLEDMAEFLQRQAKSGANHTGAFNSARNPRSLWLWGTQHLGAKAPTTRRRHRQHYAAAGAGRDSGCAHAPISGQTSLRFPGRLSTWSTWPCWGTRALSANSPLETWLTKQRRTAHCTASVTSCTNGYDVSTFLWISAI